MKFSINIPKIPKIQFKHVIIGLIVILIIGILLLTCRKPKPEPAALHPTKTEIDQATREKKSHDAFVSIVNWKITTLEKQKDSAIKIIEKKDAEIQAKSLKITALTKQASTAKANDDELLFEQSCDSLLPQVNDLVEAVDVLQQDNRNVQNAYDSLLGATSLKMGRLEYDYSELQERFDRVSKNANGLETSNHKLGKKADKRIILGFQVGGTYSIQQNKPIPYAGFGVTYRIARF